MKKLIAISVVFALVAGVAFAVDLGANVIGTVNVLESNPDDVQSSGTMNRVRIDGSGEAGDGAFGGYYRLEAWHWSGEAFFGNVWWKPLDQFKLILGSNGGDGFYGKEGVTGWMFYQTACDTGVTNPNNTWGGSLYGIGVQTRDAFYGGDGGFDQVRLEIAPADIAKINVVLPFFGGGKTADVFKKTTFQLDLNLDFGNIAVTYVGNMMEGDQQPSIYGYFGGSFGDLSLDVGIGFTLPNEDGTSNPIGIGVGVKYAMDTLGVKFRTVAKLAGEDKATRILADVMPYFVLGDNLTAFVSVGIGMLMPDGGDSQLGWHFNPYIQVGEEWGAKFLAGIKASSSGVEGADVEWSVPIALIVSF